MKSVLLGVALVLMLFIGFAQTIAPGLMVRSPLVRDSHIVEFAVVTRFPNGSTAVGQWVTSSDNKRGEIILSRSWPDQPLKTAVSRVVDTTNFALVHLAEVFRLLSKEQAHDQTAATCVPQAADVVAKETILDHLTIASAFTWPGSSSRVTVWQAPDLGCLTLMSKVEERQPDGQLVLRSEKKAVRLIAIRKPEVRAAGT